MIAVVCVDDRGGMLFNRRRQSQDRLLRQDLLEEAKAGWYKEQTRKLALENDALEQANAAEAGKECSC